MANNISPSKVINYISQKRKILVGRNNQVNQDMLKFDYRVTDKFNFQVVNSINQILPPTSTKYELFGSYVDNKQQLHILFFAQNDPVTGNTIPFTVDTYTSEFMNYVKIEKEIDLTIVAVNPENDNDKSMVLRDRALVYPRPYIQGRVPTQILQRTILSFNNPVSGLFAAGSNFSYIDRVVNNFSLGEGLYTDTENQLVIGSYNLPSATTEQAFVIGNGEDNTHRSNALSIDYDGNIVTNGTISASTIYVNGKEVGTQVDEKLSATSAWVTDTFETKDASNAAFNALETELGEISAAVSSITIPTNISYFNNDVGYLVQDNLSSYATKSWVQSQGYLTEHQSLSAYATKSWVEGKNYLVAADLSDYATKQWVTQKGYLIPSDLDGFATQTWVLGKNYLISSDLNGYARTSQIPTKVSDLTNDSNFITSSQVPVYTAGEGIKVENYVISLTGSTGQNYTAGSGIIIDNGIIKTNLIPGQNITFDVVGNKVTINAISGGSGGGGTYTAGQGLNKVGTTFSVDQEWLSTFIDTRVGDIEIYTAGSGISIEDGVISLTATLSSITNDAGFITSSDLDGYATETYVDSAVSSKLDSDTFETISGELTSAIAARALETDLQYVSGVVDNKAETSALNDYVLTSAMSAYAESGWVDDNYMKKNAVPTDVYTKSEVDTAIETATSGKADLSSVYTKEEVYTYLETDAKINAATSGKADLSAVEAEFTATSAWANETFLKDHQSLSAYYTKDEVNAITGTLEGEITGKVAQSEFNTVSSGLSTAIDSKANSADVYTQTQIDTALALKANATDVYTKDQVDTISGNLHNEITGATSGVATEEWVEGHFLSSLTSADIPEEFVTATELATALEPYAISADVDTAIETASGNLQTAIGGVADRVSAIETSGLITADEVDTKIATATTDMATQTWANGKFETIANVLTGYNDLTGRINTASTTLTGQVSDLQTATNNQFTATSTWINNTFETITNVNALTSRVKAIEDDYTTSAYVTGQVNDLATGAVLTNTNNISQLSTDLGTVSGKANTNETNIGLVSSDLDTLSGELNTTSTFISGKVDTLSGQLNTASSTLTSQTNYLSGQIDTNTTNIGLVDGRVQVIEADYIKSADMTATSTWVNNTFETIANVSSKLDATSTYINEVSAAISGAADNKFATKTTVEGIDTRVTTNANAITSAQTDIENVSGIATTNQTNIGTLSTDFGTANEKISTLSTDLGTVSGKANTNATNIGTLSTDLGTVSGKANTNADNISSLSTRMGTAEGNISQLSTDLGTVSGKANTNADNISTISGNLNTVSGNLNTVSGDLDTAETNIGNLRTDVNTISTTYATIDYVDTTSSTLSTELTGWVDDNYITGYTAGSGIQITEENVINVTINTIPSAVSQLVNDSNFITYADIVDGVEYHAGEGLSLINNTFALTGTILSGDGTTIAIDPVTHIVSYVGSSTGGVEYTAGSGGIEIDNNDHIISISADFIDNTELATALEPYALSTDVDASIETASGNIEAWATSTFLTDVPTSYATKQYVDDISSALSTTVANADYQNSTDVTNAINSVTGTLSTELTGWVDDQGYVKTDTKYLAGTGLELDTTTNTFSLSAAGVGENKVLSSQNGNIVWANNVAGGGGGGTTYTAGTGIDITNDEISVKQIELSTSLIFNDVPFVSAEDITNKQRVHSVNGPIITYDPSFEVFKTTYETSAIVLNPVTVTTTQVGNGEVATFEEWITLTGSATTTFEVDENIIKLIGDWPDTIDNAKTHVLVRRLYNNNGTIVQYVSYAYNF